MLLDYPRSTTMYCHGGTRTFREGSKMVLGIIGENMQNKEKELREIYLSDGWKFEEQELLIHYLKTGDIAQFTEEQLARIKILLQVDQSGAEALIVAYLCKAGKFRDLFIYGVKPHVYVALHIFEQEWRKRLDKQEVDLDALLHAEPKTLTSVPGFKIVDKLIRSSDDWQPEERFYFMAKKVCHSGNYDAKGPTLVMGILLDSGGAIALPASAGTKFLDFYHVKLFPEIRGYHNEIQNTLIKDKRILRNLFGEPREFNGIWGDSLWKEAYAFIPQSTVGQITNKAIQKLYLEISNDNLTDTDLLQNGHDSVLAQTRITQEHFIASTMQHYIEIELVNNVGEKFKMKSEAQRGFSWGPMKKKKNGSISNPIGMQSL